MTYLSILNGSQAGNYIELEPNKPLTMASSFGSDIYLLLPNTSDFECSFTVSAEYKLSIQSCSQQILINDLPIELNTSYQLPALLNILNTHIAISNNPHIQIEDFAIINLDHENISVDNSNENPPNLEELNKLGISPFTDEHRPGKLYQLWNQFNTKFKNNILTKKLQPLIIKLKKSKIYSNIVSSFKHARASLIELISLLYVKLGYWLYAVIAAILAIIVSSSMIFYQLHQQEQVEIQQHNRQLMKSLLNQQLLKLPSRYAGLRIIEKDENYQLGGVIAEQKDVNYLKKLFKSINPKLKYNLQLFGTIQPQLLLILQQHKIMRPRVSFESETGTLAISGITNSMEIIDDVEIAISNQYPNLGKIDSATMFLINDLDSSIETIISNDNFKQHLEVKKNYAEGIITIEGYLASNDIQTLTSQVKQFNQKYLPEARINLNVQDLIKALPFAIREVYTGTPNYIITGDGQRIYPGGHYKGITVNQISKDKIIFQGKFNLTLSLAQLLPSQNMDNTNEPNYSAPTQQIIDQQENNESENINREKAQIENLRQILLKTNNPELQETLTQTINKLTDELKYRESEYNYYFRSRNNDRN